MPVGGGQQVLTYLVLGGGGAGDEAREEEDVRMSMNVKAFRLIRKNFGLIGIHLCVFFSHTSYCWCFPFQWMWRHRR